MILKLRQAYGLSETNFNKGNVDCRNKVYGLSFLDLVPGEGGNGVRFAAEALPADETRKFRDRVSIVAGSQLPDVVLERNDVSRENAAGFVVVPYANGETRKSGRADCMRMARGLKFTAIDLANGHCTSELEYAFVPDETIDINGEEFVVMTATFDDEDRTPGFGSRNVDLYYQYNPGDRRYVLTHIGYRNGDRVVRTDGEIPETYFWFEADGDPQKRQEEALSRILADRDKITVGMNDQLINDSTGASFAIRFDFDPSEFGISTSRLDDVKRKNWLENLLIKLATKLGGQKYAGIIDLLRSDFLDELVGGGAKKDFPYSKKGWAIFKKKVFGYFNQEDIAGRLRSGEISSSEFYKIPVDRVNNIGVNCDDLFKKDGYIFFRVYGDRIEFLASAKLFSGNCVYNKQLSSDLESTVKMHFGPTFITIPLDGELQL